MRIASLLLLTLLCGAQEVARKPTKATRPVRSTVTVNRPLSYALGQEAAQRVKKLNVPLDAASFRKGLEDAFKKGPGQMTLEEGTELIRVWEAEQARLVGERNRKAGADFLAQNRTAPGVLFTPSGLQYQMLTVGTGDQPAPEDTVKVHYRGTLLDGTEFDSSYKRGEPSSFGVTRVIKGWTEGLQLMKVGGKARFFIPFDLAYGERGRNAIPPCALLIFDVELLGVEKPKK
jgi:FKBP-type peptidyl-prolyl cis-trans isomerase FkpA